MGPVYRGRPGVGGGGGTASKAHIPPTYFRHNNLYLVHNRHPKISMLYRIYIYIYICIYVYIYICIYVYMYICICIYVYMYMCICVYV